MRPDAEKLAVQWAKANSAITALVSGRVSTNLPKDPTMPFLLVARVGGGVDPSNAPIDRPYLQWDAYGAKGNHTPDYDSAYKLASTLIDELEFFSGKVGAHGVIMGTQIVNGPRRIEEPATGWARFMVETVVLTRGS